MEGVRLVGERYGIAPSDITYFTHGTTVGINTVIQRKGLKLALITTEGFRDVLEVARLKIPDMYNLLSARPAPLIPRDRVYGVGGRMRADGTEAYLPFLEALDSLLQSDSSGAAARLMKAVAPAWYVQVAPQAAGDPALTCLPAEARAASQEHLKRELSAFLKEFMREEQKLTGARILLHSAHSVLIW